MTPIFAPQDIAALVATYPPPSPTEEKHSLLRTYSKNNLVQSAQVLKNFGSLLETAPKSIALSNLSTQLDIENPDQVLEIHRGRLHYSHDRQSLLPQSLTTLILHAFQSECRTAFVDLATFAKENDISTASLHDLLPLTPGSGTVEREYRTFLCRENGAMYIAHKTLVIQTETQILQAVKSHAGQDGQVEELDLSSRFSVVPTAVLLEMSRSSIKNMETAAGSVDIRVEDGTQRIVFTPLAYFSANQERNRMALEKEVEKFVSTLQREGWVLLSERTLSDAKSSGSGLEEVAKTVSEAYSRNTSQEEVFIFHQITAADGRTVVLAVNSTLQKTMQELQTAAEALVGESSRDSASSTPPPPTSTASLSESDEAVLSSRTSHPVLSAAILTKPTYKLSIDTTYCEAHNQLTASQTTAFSILFIENVSAPISLYMTGVSHLQDETLRLHVEDYTRGFLAREVITPFLATARERGLLSDKARSREMEKCAAACTGARTTADIHTAVLKSSRKLKVDTSLSEEVLETVKKERIERLRKGVKRLERGSDILQHWIWISMGSLMAGGLVVSSGKDTSRMIRELVRMGADEEVVRVLGFWRDRLKEGGVGERELEEMKGLAMGAI